MFEITRRLRRLLAWTWFEGRPYRFVGYAAEDYGFNGAVELGHQFDGMLFVDHTTGARPIGLEPWPR